MKIISFHSLKKPQQLEPFKTALATEQGRRFNLPKGRCGCQHMAFVQ